MKLLYFTDLSQLNYVLDYSPELLKLYMPITGDLVVLNKLEKLGVSFINEWDYLPKESIDYSWKTSQKLINRWSKELKLNDIVYKDITLSECAKQDLALSFEAALNSKQAYEKVINEFKVTSIFGFFLPNIPVIRTGPAPTHRAVRSISQNVLFWLAENKNIPIVKFESSYDLSDAISSKGRNNIVSNQIFNSSIKKEKKVLFLFLDCLHKDEIQEIKYSYKNLTDWAVIPFSNNISDYCQFEELDGTFLETYQKFIELSSNYTGAYPEIFGNHYLHFQFKGIWSEMKKAAILVDILDPFYQILKPQISVFGYDAFTIESALIELSKKYEIPTVSLLHTGLGHSFSYVGMTGKSDNIIVWNNWDKVILEKYGLNQNRIHVLGSIRYEKLFLNLKRRTQLQLNEKRTLTCAKLGLNRDKPIVLLLTTAINTGFSVPVSNPSDHIRGLDDIVKYVEKRPDLQFIIKPHPSFDYYELYRNISKYGLSNLFFIEKVNFDEVVDISTVSVILNYFTTAALESLIYKTPVLYFNNAVYKLIDWRVSIEDLNIKEVSSVLNLEHEIDKVISSNNKFNDSIFDSSKIENVIGVSSNNISTRFVDLIERISKKNSSEFLNDIIYNNSSKINFNELAKRYSVEKISFVFSYTYGSLKIGLVQLFELFISLNKNYIKSSNKFKMNMLILPYIYGSRSNLIINDRLSAIKIIAFLALRPSFYTKLNNENQVKAKEFIYFNLRSIFK